MRLYVNGEKVGKDDTNDWVTKFGDKADICGANDAAGYFKMDNLIIWDDALTDFSHRFDETPPIPPWCEQLPVCDGKTVTIVGTEGHDIIKGTSGPDVIHGLAGHDIIYARGGNDVICGGDGNDTLHSSEGNDRLYGENGHDTLWAGSDNDKLWGGSGIDVLNGGDGDDILRGNGGNDTLRGGEGVDELYGGWGNDTCYDEDGTFIDDCDVFIPLAAGVADPEGLEAEYDDFELDEDDG